MSQLENLLQQLQQSTVKLTLPNRMRWGTGFFVAPGLILTCAHVVQGAEGESVQVRWQNQENWTEAVVERSLPAPYDLALLRVTIPTHTNPPCVYLDEEIRSRDPLYLFGYPDEGDRQGEPRTFNCEGTTGSEIPSILFNLGQVRPGMSGSPLLNQRTHKVCGIVKFTRDRSNNLGGGAIPTRIVLEQFPQLQELQREFHEGDRRWSNLAAKLSNPAHHSDSSQVKPTVKKILMLSANPENPETSRRRKEIKEIRNALDRAEHGNLFDLQDRSDTGASELSEELVKIEPYIVDISGHEDGIESLVLENISDNTTSGNTNKLIAQLFELHEKSIKVVVLNRCYSGEQAREIAQHIEFVIGMNQSLKDSEVLDFLKAFYVYLGSERTVEDSYKAGFDQLSRKGLEDAQLLILLRKRDEIQRRELEEELKSCEREIEQDQNNSKLWKKRADILTDLKRSEEANESYKKASSIEPDNPNIKTRQGDALEQFGKHVEAANAYDKALELKPEDYKVWWKKGQVLVKAEKYDEAVESYEKAVLLDPPSPDNYVICREYGSLLRDLNQDQKSIALYKKSLAFEAIYRISNYEKRQVYKKMYFGKG